jgi:acyl-CoA synthetase (AMP-forming)/AMP-acid ligase II
MPSRRYKISHLSLVPSVVHQLVNHPNIHNVNLNSVQVIGCGAAYLPPDLAERMKSITPKGTELSQGNTL